MDENASLRLWNALQPPLALLLLILLAPLLALIALAIKLTSRGPVLFRQPRAGLGGEPFTLFKFRTMVPGAVEIGRGIELAPSDARITPVGRLLRRLALDELPQLWNVVRGEMALVGPRPALLEQAEEYDRRARRRLSVRPGLTGWAQLNGRERIPWEARIELDLDYLERRSPWLDLWILLRTPTLLLREAFLGQGIPWRELLVDALIVALSLSGAYLLRFEGALPDRYLAQLAWLLPVLVVLRISLLWLFGVSRWARHRFGVAEASALLKALAPVSLMLVAARLLAPWEGLKIPLSVVALEGTTSFLALMLLRLPGAQEEPALAAGEAESVLIVGAGSLGRRVAEELRSGDSPCHLVGFLDDAPQLQDRRVLGLPVLGPTAEVGEVLGEQQVERLVLAIARPEAELVDRLREAAETAGCEWVRVPGVREALQGEAATESP